MISTVLWFAFLHCGSVGLGLYSSDLGSVKMMGPIKAVPDCFSVIFHLDVFRVKLPLGMSVLGPARPGRARQLLSPVQ